MSKIHSSGKYRFCGVDKAGCPILVIRMRYHVKGLADADQNLRYLLYMIEKGVKMAREASKHSYTKKHINSVLSTIEGAWDSLTRSQRKACKNSCQF